jgi:NhaA family Na+:H+ antiporter
MAASWPSFRSIAVSDVAEAGFGLTPAAYFAWQPVMAQDRSSSVLQSLIRSETAGGLLLMAAAVLALVIANSGASDAYFALLETHVGPLSMLHWVNDALMAVFFLLVGLEVKREFTEGQLATWAERRLPVIAATAGMIVPAFVYLLAIGGEPTLTGGWAIPTATDIAFALAVLALAGSRVPPSLKLLLTTIAVVDDVLAVGIIAVFYTADLNLLALLSAGLVLLAMFGLNRAGVTRLWPYVSLAILLWIAVHSSGVHATIAGVLAAAAIPSGKQPSPLDRIEHAIQPWVAFAVLPIFAFANAGVRLGDLPPEALLSPLVLAIAAGLFIGKQLGVFGSIRLAVALGWGQRPRGASWLQVYALALLCGIGFTISLFIGGLAFDDPMMIDEVKIGVLAGSIASALAGFALLRFGDRR